MRIRSTPLSPAGVRAFETLRFTGLIVLTCCWGAFCVRRQGATPALAVVLISLALARPHLTGVRQSPIWARTLVHQSPIKARTPRSGRTRRRGARVSAHSGLSRASADVRPLGTSAPPRESLAGVGGRVSAHSGHSDAPRGGPPTRVSPLWRGEATRRAGVRPLGTVARLGGCPPTRDIRAAT